MRDGHISRSIIMIGAARPHPADNVVVRREKEGAVALDPKGILVSLNASALAIWDLCDGETSIEEIGAALAELTGMGEQEALSQVLAVIEDLERRGLLEVD
jgi:Coenzyme PQQ synthesis protein D (PqqD)